MESQWSSRPPVVDGYFWWRMNEDSPFPQLLLCIAGKAKDFEGFVTPVAERGGQWQGPLCPDNGGPHMPLLEAVAVAARRLEDAAAGLKALALALKDGR